MFSGFFVKPQSGLSLSVFTFKKGVFQEFLGTAWAFELKIDVLLS